MSSDHAGSLKWTDMDSQKLSQEIAILELAQQSHRTVLCTYRVIVSSHRKKNFSIFPSLAGMSLTKLSLGRNNDVVYKLFPLRESLVSDILAGDINIEWCLLSRGLKQQ